MTESIKILGPANWDFSLRVIGVVSLIISAPEMDRKKAKEDLIYKKKEANGHTFSTLP